MFKPKAINGGMACGFGEQEKQVSISVDSFDFSDTTPFRVFWQIEPPEIFNTQQHLIDNHKFYDLILTWDEKVLAACPNAVKFVYGTCRFSTDPKDNVDASKKRFAVSYLTSSKTMCAGHNFRHEIFGKLPSSIGSLPVIKHMSPPEIEKADMLIPFQFTIVMENSRYQDWITEKLIDALVMRTIPIYWGAPNVGEYFDTDGILSFENYPQLLQILESLTSETYKDKVNSVDSNIHKAMQYTNHFRRIDEIIRRRLSEHTIRVPEHQRAGEEIRQPVPRQQSTVARRFLRKV